MLSNRQKQVGRISNEIEPKLVKSVSIFNKNILASLKSDPEYKC